MAEIERALLPRRQHRRKKIFVVHGLGGMGKTQLAVEFARKHHPRFSSVFWLDGQTQNSLKQSIANSASRIPEGQIAEESRSYSTSGDGNINAVVKDVLGWLTNPDNTEWLLIFDNVDRDHRQRDADPNAYDVTHYFPGADHGSILITTRLFYLEQLGASLGLKTVDMYQAHAIFQSRYGRSVGKTAYVLNSLKRIACTHHNTNDPSTDQAEIETLLSLLHGLPLALAQAASYLRETGIDFATYIKFYKQQWKELMEPHDDTGTPLQDYPDRSVWTTWTISFSAIREKNEAAANLLLLWAHLDNKDVWYGLLAAALHELTDHKYDPAECLPAWLHGIASSELKFTDTIRLLHNYSLIEDMEGLASYATHPVVHQWALHMQDETQRVNLARLAVIVIGWVLPNEYAEEFLTMQRRLFAHAHCSSQWILTSVANRSHRRGHACSVVSVEEKHAELILNAVIEHGFLCKYQNKLIEAEKVFQYALQESELAFGPEHELTIKIVGSLGIVYADQGKLAEAELMYQRALGEQEKIFNSEHEDTLSTVNNLGALYKNQGRLAEAELMYQRALQGREKALGPEHVVTLTTVYNLGNLYQDQGKPAEAEKLYQRALQGYQKTLGSENVGTHEPALDVMYNLGDLYERQGKLTEAKEMFTRAFAGDQTVFGPSHPRSQEASWRIESLGKPQGTTNAFCLCR